MASSSAKFDDALLRLRNACGPEIFSYLVDGFAEYALDVVERVVEAPADDVLRAQGRAQNCRSILQKMRDTSAKK